MKIVYTFLLVGLLIPTAGLAQRSASRWSNYDAVTTYRIGTQGVNLGELNQALQQAGYGTLPAQFTMLSVASQFSRPNRALAFNSELGISLNSHTTVSNGTNRARAGFYYFRFGASYRIIRTDKFQLAPQLGITSLPFHLQVDQISSTTPSVNSVLTNPGSAQTATLRSVSIGADAGLNASLRIPFSQRQMDCLTIERSFVIGLDAGYRFATKAPLNTIYETSSNNPAVQLSGWYAGIHIGFGSRVRSTIAPATY